jgi:hypothetical protein
VAPFQYFEDPAKTADRTSPQGWQTLGDIGYVDAKATCTLPTAWTT